jgi:hypothetical protein
MAKKIIRLTESDLARIVKRVLMENETDPMADFNKCFKSSGLDIETMPECNKLIGVLTNPETKEYPDPAACAACLTEVSINVNPFTAPLKIAEISRCLFNTYNKSQNPTKS